MKERERVKENAGTCMGGGVFGQQCEVFVRAAVAPLNEVCVRGVYVSWGTTWRRGGTPIPRPPRRMRRLICQRICDCECRD